MVIRQTWVRLCMGAAVAALGLSACETLPVVRTEMAPGANLAQYHTYDYFEKLSTDRRGYTTITTRSVQTAIDREMRTRGFVRGPNPDLKINFNIAKRDKVTSVPGPNYGFGYGGWRSSYGYGIGFSSYSDIETITEGTLTLDLVDRAKNELIWSGSAVRTLDSKALDQPQKTIDQAVNLIFAKYPAPAATASAM